MELAAQVDRVASLIAQRARVAPVLPVEQVEQVARVAQAAPVAQAVRVAPVEQVAGVQVLAPAGAEILRVHLAGQADVLRAGASQNVQNVKSLTIWKHRRWAAYACHAAMEKVFACRAAPASPISLTRSTHHRLTWSRC